MSRRAAFYTLGCKLNFSETSSIGKQFLKRGYDVVDFGEKADVYVINTCTVTQNADRDCRQVVRRARRQNPGAYIIVTGCYAQLKPKEITEIEGVDAVFGSNEKFRIFDYLGNFEKQDLSCIFVTPTEDLKDTFFSASSTDADSRTRAFLKVQDGCDYKCSFCTIPLARGKSRSAPVEEVKENFITLLDEGYKEIILTGVNVGDYGHNGTDFYNLLRELVAIEGDFRMRISSIEPNLLTDDIISLAADTEKICDHFHIPLQSGSSEMLKKMRRRYRVSDYERVVNKVISKIPDAGIGVDVITGSPGETEDLFLETYNFIRDLPASYLHVFTYSERPNTDAILMDGQVEKAERKRRNNMLRILSSKKKHEFYERMIGKELNVLFEHQDHDGEMKGFASNYVRVKAPYDEMLVNKFAGVKIASIDDETCIPEEIIKEEINNLAG